MTSTVNLAAMSQGAYLRGTDTKLYDNGYEEILFRVQNNFWSNGQGFTAHAYFSESERTLVIAFSGTNVETSYDGVSDFYIDLQLAVGLATAQNPYALDFSGDAIEAATGSFGGGYNIVFTGHSPGGYLAQAMADQHYPNQEAVVFNSPGLGGLFGSPNSNSNVTYYFSNPTTWNFLDDRMHLAGEPVSDNVFLLIQQLVTA